MNSNQEVNSGLPFTMEVKLFIVNHNLKIL